MNIQDMPRVDYEIDTPGDFILSVTATLIYWLMTHTDAECWASNMTEVYDDYESTLDIVPVLDFMGGVKFDLAEAVVEAWCEKHADEFFQCVNCGVILDNGLYCDCEEEDQTEDKVEWRDLFHYFEELYFYKKWDIEWVKSIATNGLIERILETDGFRIYRQAVSMMTNVDDCIDEVSDALRQLDVAVKAGRSEALAAATWASHIRHVHGEIMKDYCDNVGANSYDLDEIQQNGIANDIGQDVVDTWLAGESDPNFESEFDSMCRCVRNILNGNPTLLHQA